MKLQFYAFVFWESILDEHMEDGWMTTKSLVTVYPSQQILVTWGGYALERD